MQIASSTYPAMRAWFAHVAPRLFPNVSVEADPVLALDRIEAISMANARKGLSMAIGDIVEMTDNWPNGEIASLDAELTTASLPTLSAIRIQFSKSIRSIVRRGSIKNDEEYYLIRNAAEMDPERGEELFGLLEKWEGSALT